MKKKSSVQGTSRTVHYDEPRAYDAYSIFFETLANQNRLHIINSIRTTPKNVGQIVEATGLEQTCVSHCLKRLENCGFVSAKRDGKFRVYTLNKKTIEPLMRLIDAHTNTYCIHLIGDAACAHHKNAKQNIATKKART